MITNHWQHDMTRKWLPLEKLKKLIKLTAKTVDENPAGYKRWISRKKKTNKQTKATFSPSKFSVLMEKV